MYQRNPLILLLREDHLLKAMPPMRYNQNLTPSPPPDSGMTPAAHLERSGSSSASERAFEFENAINEPRFRFTMFRQFDHDRGEARGRCARVRVLVPDSSASSFSGPGDACWPGTMLSVSESESEAASDPVSPSIERTMSPLQIGQVRRRWVSQGVL
jgi:hypothetical protein